MNKFNRDQAALYMLTGPFTDLFVAFSIALRNKHALPTASAFSLLISAFPVHFLQHRLTGASFFYLMSVHTMMILRY